MRKKKRIEVRSGRKVFKTAKLVKEKRRNKARRGGRVNDKPEWKLRTQGKTMTDEKNIRRSSSLRLHK